MSKTPLRAGSKRVESSPDELTLIAAVALIVVPGGLGWKTKFHHGY